MIVSTAGYIDMSIFNNMPRAIHMYICAKSKGKGNDQIRKNVSARCPHVTLAPKWLK